MKLRYQIGIYFVAFTFTLNAFAACEYEKDKLKIASDACTAASTIGNCVTAGSTIGAAIACAASGNVIYALIGLAGFIPTPVTKRLCDLKDEREQQLKECEDHQAFLAKTEEEQRRIEWIQLQTKVASEVGARLFMNRVAEFEAAINREINDIYGVYLDSGRLSIDPNHPTDPAIFQELLDGETAIRARYF